MDKVKIRVKINKTYPAMWTAVLQLGKMHISGWGFTPAEACYRLLTEPTARNNAGYTIRSV